MKNVFTLIGIFLIITSFFLLSCGKNGITPDGEKIEEPVDSTFFLRFEKDGDALGFANTIVTAIGPRRPLDSIKPDEPLIIGARNGNTQIEIYMWGKPQVGTFEYSTPPDSLPFLLPSLRYYDVEELWSSYLLNTEVPTTGKVTITKITETTIEGTFEGKLLKDLVVTPAILITNGQFVAKKRE